MNYLIIIIFVFFNMYMEAQEFLKAAKEGDISKLKNTMVNDSISIVNSIKDNDNNTVLIIAVQKNYVALATELLRMKADINIENNNGDSALTLAIKLKNKYLVTVLLQNAYNVKIDKPDKDGNTPLMLAVQNGDLDVIKKIVAEVPNPDIKNLKNEMVYNFVKDTPDKQEILELLEKAKKQYTLHEAIKKQDFSAIKNSDAPLNISSVERNPLVVAISQKNKELVEEIINKGANVNQILRGNKTPLSEATFYRDTDIFNFLLKKGANPNIADIYDGYTPIFMTLLHKNIYFMHSLIKNKANINYQASSYYPGKPGNETPLMLATEIGYPYFVETLLDAGADPLLKNSEGKTALDIARLRQQKMYKEEYQRYQEIITLLENKMKTIPISTPSTPSQLISLLHNLTQRLRILIKVLQKN